MGRSSWITPFRRSGQGRPRPKKFSKSITVKAGHEIVPKWGHKAFFGWLPLSTSPRFHVANAVMIASDDLRHSFLPHICLRFSYIMYAKFVAIYVFR